MAEQDYEHSGPEDNSSEEDHAALVHKALAAAVAITAILELLGDDAAIEFALADVAGRHLADYCEEHRAESRNRLVADIDSWTARYVAENAETDEEEPRRLDS